MLISSPGSPFAPEGFFATTAPWTASRASVQRSRAAYRLFSRLCLRHWLVSRKFKGIAHGDELFIKLQSHCDLINPPVDFSVQDETNK